MKKTHMEQIECFAEGTLDHQETRELLLTLSRKPELVSQLQDNLYMDTLIDQHLNSQNQDFYENLMESIEEQNKPEQVLPSSSTQKFRATNKILARAKVKKKKKSPIIKYVAGLAAVASIIVMSVISVGPKLTSNLIISSIDGQGTVYRQGEYFPITQGMLIFKGDSVSSTKGNLIINFQNEASFIELSNDSTIRIDYDPQKDDQQKIIYAEFGNSKYTIQKQMPNKPMIVNSKAASVKVIGTVFNVKPNGSKTSINTIKGLINITNNKSRDKFDLPAGYKTIVDSKELPEIISLDKNAKPKILSYSLIDPNTGNVNEKYFRINNNSVLKVSDFSNLGYNIRVNISDHSKIYRVEFILSDQNGTVIHVQKEKIYPYMMAGDELKGALKFNYEFNSLKVIPGSYRLETHIYTNNKIKKPIIRTFNYSIK